MIEISKALVALLKRILKEAFDNICRFFMKGD